MKKLLFILLLFASFAASAQYNFPSLDSLRKYNNRFITNSAINAFTDYRLNTLLNGMIAWIDSAGGGSSGVDSIWAINDSTLRYRKGLSLLNVTIKGGRDVDTIYRKPGKDSLYFTINGVERRVLDSVGGAPFVLYNALGGTGDTLVNADKEVKWLNPGDGILHTITGTTITVKVDSSKYATQYDLTQAAQNIQQVLTVGDTAKRTLLYKDLGDTATTHSFTENIIVPSNYNTTYGSFGTSGLFTRGFGYYHGVNISNRPNIVYSILGYNQPAGAGGQTIAGEAAFGFRAETDFVLGGSGAFEFHLPEITTSAGYIYRPWSWYISKVGRGATLVSQLTSASFQYLNSSGAADTILYAMDYAGHEFGVADGGALRLVDRRTPANYWQVSLSNNGASITASSASTPTMISFNNSFNHTGAQSYIHGYTVNNNNINAISIDGSTTAQGGYPYLINSVVSASGGTIIRNVNTHATGASVSITEADGTGSAQDLYIGGASNTNVTAGLFTTDAAYKIQEGSYPGNVNLLTLKLDQHAGIGGITSPTAALHFPIGTTAAATAPVKFELTSAALMTTPEAGAMEAVGSYLFYTNSTPTRDTLLTWREARTNFGGSAFTFTNGLTNTAGTVTWEGDITKTTALNAHNNFPVTFDSLSTFNLNVKSGLGGMINVRQGGNVRLSISSSTSKMNSPDGNSFVSVTNTQGGFTQIGQLALDGSDSVNISSGYGKLHISIARGFRIEPPGAKLYIDSLESGASTDSLLTWNSSTQQVRMKNMAGLGGIYGGSGSLPGNVTVTDAGNTLTLTGTQSSSAAFNVSNTGNGSAGAFSTTGTGSALSGTNSSSGNGLFGSSSSGNGLSATSVTGLAGRFKITPSSTNTIVSVLDVIAGSSGTPAAGRGAAINLKQTDDAGNDVTGVRLSSVFTSAATGSTSSEFQVNTTNAGSNTLNMTLKATGAFRLNAYITGAFTGTPTDVLASDASGNVIQATPTQISALPIFSVVTADPTDWTAAANTMTKLPDLTGAGSHTVTLPSAATNVGRQIILWNRDASGNNWTFAAAITLPDGTTSTAFADGTMMTVISDGSVWVQRNVN